LHRELGDQQGEAAAFVHLGDTYAMTGDTTAARLAWEQALPILDGLDALSADAEEVRAKLAALDTPDDPPA
jgi:predicted negative regulator of RcsB-dependent stress response